MLYSMSIEPAVSVERINRLMELRGWGPGELEYQSGVNYDTIYKLRIHKRPRTSAEVLAKLAQALGCSVDYLVGLTDSPLPNKLNVSLQIEELLAAIGQLSPRRQRDLRKIVAALEAAEQEEARATQWRGQLNQILLDEIEKLGGEDLLGRFYDLLGIPPDVRPDDMRRLPPSQTPDEDEDEE